MNGRTILLGGGLLLGALGLVLFAGAIANGATATLMLACLVLAGIGGSVAFNALSVAIMSDVPMSELGVASGIISTISLMASTIGLVIFASAAHSRADHLLASGLSSSAAMSMA